MGIKKSVTHPDVAPKCLNPEICKENISVY